MSTDDIPADIAALSYEDARDELTAIVAKLEGGQTSLEDSLTLWERGELLARVCQEYLAGAQARLDAIRVIPVEEIDPDADAGD
ncbi:MAG TPA: exodeoxyribonuclease VII small subunit [Actinobacteria bacterium]|nr:exodeoxyribonuclease VII small subunit [Actinomycetota bacterium]